MSKDQLLGRVAVVAETEHAGSVTGTPYWMAGLREFEPAFDPAWRTTRTGVWRLEESQRSDGNTYNGRLDIEAFSSQALLLMFGAMMVRTLQDDGSARYTPQLSQRPYVPSLRFYIAYDEGPWYELRGVACEAFRLAVRAQQLVHVSTDWLAAELVVHTVDPGWDFAEERNLPENGSASNVYVDEAEVPDSVEVGVTLQVPTRQGNTDRDGVPTRAIRTGPTTVTGSISKYVGAGDAMPAVVFGREEFALALVLGEGILMVLPRCLPQEGMSAPVGDQDVTLRVPFKALTGSSADVPYVQFAATVVPGSSSS